MTAVIIGMAIGLAIGIALEELAVGIALGAGFALVLRSIALHIWKQDEPAD